MWQHTQIKDSDSYVVFDNFDVFYTIARQMRGCHYYYLSREDRVMYACNDEGFALHCVDIPDVYDIPRSIYFDILSLNETVIKQYVSFVMYDKLPFMMLPLSTKADHTSYNLVFTNDKWVVCSKNNYIDFLTLYNVEVEMLEVRKIYNLVKAKYDIEPFLGELQLYGNQETQPAIREAFDNKASSGKRYLRLTNMQGKNYGLIVFKNLFNLNKADNLTIVIRDRLDNPGLFQASFVTVKKKSPIPTIIPFFRESVYATFINIG